MYGTKVVQTNEPARFVSPAVLPGFEVTGQNTSIALVAPYVRVGTCRMVRWMR
jgi:hypothetical protein